MSSSTHCPDVPFVVDGKPSSSSSSTGFKRWSRNLSAQRHRELDRLNQIERRRQLLELKGQNDLFDQMSAASGQPSSQQQAVRPKQCEPNRLDQPPLAVTLAQQTPDQPDSKSSANRAATANDESHPDMTSPNRSQVPEGIVRGTDDLTVTSTNLVDKPSEGHQTYKGKASEPTATGRTLVDSKLREPTLASHKNSGPRTPERNTAEQIRSINDHDGQTSGAVANNSGSAQKSLQQLDAAPSSAIISDRLLAQFVAHRVPKNKRVLCLLVRDKISRLNKAKSYFYPTYYLFIQAIVDINEHDYHYCLSDQFLASSVGDEAYGEDDDDEIGNAPLGGKQPALAPVAHTIIKIPDHNNETTNAATNNNQSSDNSFSASSSISADMMFIGAGSNVGATDQSTVAKAADELSHIKMSGNSYSDNEVCSVDTETEDDHQRPLGSSISGGKQIGARTDQLDGDKSKSPGGLQVARDSPLVFPNGTNIAAKGSAATSTIHKVDSVLRHKEHDDDDRGGNSTTPTLLQGNIVLGNNNNKKSSSSSSSTTSTTGRNNNNELILSRMKRLPVTGIDTGGRGSATGGSCITVDDNEQHAQEDELPVECLFDNDRNPYTGTYGVLLAGRRRKKAKTYLIGLNEYGYTRRNSICKLKSNVLGTQFNAIRLNGVDGNDRCTVASISYETNVLGFKGPRKMRVFLTKDPLKGSKNLPETFKKNPDAVFQLKNMTPSWNVESQSYVLNFHGRVTQASVKNFQLIECEDHLTEGQNRQLLDYNNNIIKQQVTANNSDHSTRKSHLTGVQGSSSNLTGQLPPATGVDRTNHHAKAQDSELTDTHLVLDTRPTLINSSMILNNGASGSGIDGAGLSQQDKNCQLLMSNKSLTYNSSIVMQFGRIANNEFTCDVTYPLSILQAFSIALSSFDSKLACE